MGIDRCPGCQPEGTERLIQEANVVTESAVRAALEGVMDTELHKSLIEKGRG
jgi:hypothetical protein